MLRLTVQRPSVTGTKPHRHLVCGFGADAGHLSQLLGIHSTVEHYVACSNFLGEGADQLGAGQSLWTRERVRQTVPEAGDRQPVDLDELRREVDAGTGGAVRALRLVKSRGRATTG